MPGTCAADGAHDDPDFRGELEARGITPGNPRNPRSKRRPKQRRIVPGRRAVERAHTHLGCAFRGVRTRWERLVASFEASLGTVAAHSYIDRARL